MVKIATDKKIVIYPNPATNAFNIKYDLTKDERVSISIYSSDMKPVKQIEYAKQSAGTHILTVDASKLSSDVYFAKFQSGSISKTIKVIVVH